MDERYDWSPEPELVDFSDPERSRASLEAFGDAVWREALDWLYNEAMKRPIRRAAYPEARRTFFGPDAEPAVAPSQPEPWPDVLQCSSTAFSISLCILRRTLCCS
jgi:hypothetical protein